MRMENSSAPSASTLYPQSVRFFLCGSMPTHKGPYWAIELLRRSPKSDRMALISSSLLACVMIAPGLTYSWLSNSNSCLACSWMLMIW